MADRAEGRAGREAFRDRRCREPHVARLDGVLLGTLPSGVDGGRRGGVGVDPAGGGGADSSDDRVDAVAVALGVVQPFQDEGRRAVGTEHGADPGSSSRLDDARVAGQIDRADDRLVKLALAEQADGDLQGA